MILALALSLAFQSGGGSCSAVTQRLTPALRRSEAARVSTLSHQRVRPGDVSSVLSEGNWRLVFATPAEAERGVFVMRRTGSTYRLIDIWGGVMAPDEHGSAATWARGLAGGGVPARLANCMDRAISAGQ